MATHEHLDEHRGYLAALIDGEGTISFSPSRTRRKDGSWRSNGTTRQVVIYNNDHQLLAAAKGMLASLGISGRVNEVATRPGCWRLSITGIEDLCLLSKEIKLRSEAKASRLQGLVESYAHA